jgi:hypothetical protein
VDRVLAPVNGEFELLGELGRGFIARVDGQRDISSSSSSSNRGFSNDVKNSILTNLESSI